MYKQPYVIPDIDIYRNNECLTIVLKNRKNEPHQLYVGNLPEVSAINQLICQNETGTFTASLPVSDGPYYFIIKSERFNTNIFSERVIPLNQAINVRDMGGYETYDGKFVKWGLLFRGDYLMKLDKADIALLGKMNIKTIIDYRSDHERLVYPNKYIPGVKCSVYCDPKSSFSESSAKAVDLDGENVKLVNELKNGEVDPQYINDKGENVILGYRELVTSDTAREAYSNFLQICAEPESTPLLHHCRGGKDRTGIGAMFLLLALGVKEEYIIKDYIITGEIRKERNQIKYEQYRELTDNKDYLNYLMTILATRAEFIQAAITMVNEMYGTAEDYLIQHLGLSKEQLKHMKQYYLENGAAC